MKEIVYMQPHIAAHRLARRALRLFPTYPAEPEDYLNLFTGVFNIMASAVASEQLKCVALPLWWPVPGHFAIDADMNFNPGLWVSNEALYKWLKTFDDTIKANNQSADVFWDAMQERGADAAETETRLSDGVSVIGILDDVPFGRRGAWYEESKLVFIREAFDALEGHQEGDGSEKQRVIKWIMGKHGGTEDNWKREIKTADIARVKNEKREK